MTLFLQVLHVMVCITLIVVVLLQRGKGAEVGAVLGGGGSNTVFGSRGAGNFLTKLTTGCAVVFMVTSLSLAYITTRQAEELIFDEEAVEQPASVLEEIPTQEAAEEPASGGLEEIPQPAPSPTPAEGEATP